MLHLLRDAREDNPLVHMTFLDESLNRVLKLVLRNCSYDPLAILKM